MREAANKILDYTRDLKTEAELEASSKTLDACIRNFQILGESAAKVPAHVQTEFPAIPWREMKGLRNFLVHEYFGVSSSILWSTIRKDLPSLRVSLDETAERLNRPVHPWRVCPPGAVYVRETQVHRHVREGSVVHEHPRREFCREIGVSGKDTLSFQEAREISDLFFKEVKRLPCSDDLDFGKSGTAYDRLIAGWTQYWNEVLVPDVPLDPDVVKAMVASESGFDSKAGQKRKNRAKGLMQLLPKTIRYLNGEQKELKDHIFSFQGQEVFDPSLNISAGIRWLFRKRETASNRLGRTASWEETVEEYKDYLRRRLKKPKGKFKGMNFYREYLARLKKACGGSP